MPTIFANFWRFQGSLSWMDNYKESLLAVYDVVMKDERQYAAGHGLPFDADSYFLEAFYEEEISILAPMIAARAEK